MELRARSIMFWPGMTLDISNTRAKCDDCNRNAPSQANLPSEPAHPPSVPFQSVVADYFDLAGRHYLVIADRLSGWVEICATPSGSQLSGAKGLIDCLRKVMAVFGVPEELASDGGPEFAASSTSEFLKRWDVKHRVSSAYFPQSNGRAEAAVKSAKRLLRSNTDTSGMLDSDKFLRAILQLRNTPDPDCGQSPAEIVLGRPLRDTLSFSRRLYNSGKTIHHAPETHPSWREAWAAKETALRDRFIRQSEKLNDHARNLNPLEVGDQVFVQNGAGNAPKRWEKTGTIKEKLDHDQYVIKVAGSGRFTTRNRKFLRRYRPVMETPQQSFGPPDNREDYQETTPLPQMDCDQSPCYQPRLLSAALAPGSFSPHVPVSSCSDAAPFHPHTADGEGAPSTSTPEMNSPITGSPVTLRRSQRLTHQTKTYDAHKGQWV